MNKELQNNITIKQELTRTNFTPTVKRNCCIVKYFA